MLLRGSGKQYVLYILLFAMAAIVFLLLIIYLPNYSFVKHVLASPLYTGGEKTRILWGLLGSFTFNFSFMQRVMAIVIALLSALNITLVVYYVRRFARMKAATGSGLLGTIIGLIGIGCSSCGSVLLTSIVGLGVTTTILTKLPLKGAEFGIVSIVILGAANYVVIRKIVRPAVCAAPLLKPSTKVVSRSVKPRGQ